MIKILDPFAMGSDLVVDIDAQPESTTKHPITASARPRKEVFFFMRIEVCAVSYDLGFGAKNEYASPSRPPPLAAEFINVRDLAWSIGADVGRHWTSRFEGDANCGGASLG